MDVLFESEQIKKKSYVNLKKDYPDRIKVIENYITYTFKCKLAQIHKVITDKTNKIE